MFNQRKHGAINVEETTKMNPKIFSLQTVIIEQKILVPKGIHYNGRIPTFTLHFIYARKLVRSRDISNDAKDFEILIYLLKQ